MRLYLKKAENRFVKSNLIICRKMYWYKNYQYKRIQTFIEPNYYKFKITKLVIGNLNTKVVDIIFAVTKTYLKWQNPIWCIQIRLIIFLWKLVTDLIYNKHQRLRPV